MNLNVKYRECMVPLLSTNIGIRVKGGDHFV